MNSFNLQEFENKFIENLQIELDNHNSEDKQDGRF